MSESCQVCGGQEAMPLVHQEPHLWVRCPDCKFSWVSPAPSRAQASGGQMSLEGYLAKLASRNRRASLRVRKMARRMNGPRLLDIGSNIGCLVAAAIDRGLDATGLESNPALIEEARRRFPEGRFVAGDLETLDLPEASFQGICCTEMIQNHPDSNRFLGHIARLTAPGGVLYLTTPALREFARGGDAARWPRFGAPDRKLLFSPANIRSQLLKHGFGQVRVLFNYGRGIKLFATRSS